MHFEFFKQKYDGKISNGDEVAVFAESDDDMPSGRYAVAGFGADADGFILATLVGMNAVEGHICQVLLNAHEEG